MTLLDGQKIEDLEARLLGIVRLQEQDETLAKFPDLNDLKTQLALHIDKQWKLLGYNKSPADFINNEVKIYNPDKKPPTIPFKLYDYQRRYVVKLKDAYDNGGILLNEKTRQMGFSWLYMAFFAWGILFDPSFTGFLMSYKEGLVDDGGQKSTTNSLLGKFRFILESLDKELFETNRIEMKYLRVRNKDTEAFIVGESSQSEAGRGGTYKIALWDETARTPKSEDIWPSFQQASKSIHLNSTVQGRGNVFARMRWEVLGPENIVTSHWTQHPEKSQGMTIDADGKPTSSWYERQKHDLKPSQLAQEVDINYETSSEGRVWSKFDYSVHIKKLEWPEMVFDEESPIANHMVLAWDLGVADEMFIGVGYKYVDGSIGVLDSFYGTDQDVRFYIDLVHGYIPQDIGTLKREDRERAEAFAGRAKSRNYRYMINVLGPDALNRGPQSKHSVKQQMNQAHLLGEGRRRYVPMQTRIITERVLETIEMVKMLLDPVKPRLFIDADQKGLIERVFNYKWKQSPQSENKQEPLHDWASHGADMIRYMVAYFLKGERYILDKPRGF